MKQKMRYWSGWVCLLLVMTGCKKDRDAIPVPTGTMIEIIADIHLAEYYSQGLGTSGTFKKNQDSLALYYNSILAHHRVSFDSFMVAYQWLMKHPLVMDSVYKAVLDNLEAMKKDYASETEAAADTARPVADTTAPASLQRPTEDGEI